MPHSLTAPLLPVMWTVLMLLYYPLCAAADNLEHQEPVDILITGSLSPQGMARIGKPITVLNERALRERRELSLGDTLSTEAGISSTSFGPGASRPVIRGQGKERVRILENGLESGDVSSVSDDHAVAIDTLTTERIDILRGPSTLMYGSQAIGGVVNIIDSAIKEEPIGRAVTGKLSLEAGDSATDQVSGAAALEGQQDSINWHISGFANKSNDIEIPGFAESERLREQEEHTHEEQLEEEDHDAARGKLANSASEAGGVKFGLSKTSSDGFLGVSLRRYGSTYGIPGHEHHAEEDEPELFEQATDEIRPSSMHAEEEDTGVVIDTDQTHLEARGAFHLHSPMADTVRFGIAYSDYRHLELEGDEIGTRFDRQSFEGRALITHHHEQYLEGGLGIQVKHDQLRAKGEEAFVPDTDSFLPAVFAIEDFSLTPNLIWQLGARVEHADINPSGAAGEQFLPVSASTGLIWKNESREYSTALNLSYGERAPNSSELFAYGPHIATQSYEIGDRSLDEERALGAELLFQKTDGRIRGSLSAFIQSYGDFISLSPTGEEIDHLPVYTYEAIDARFWGYEAQGELDLLEPEEKHRFMLYTSFDYLRGRNTDDSENLPRITPIRGKVGLRHGYEKVSSYVEGIFVGDQNRTAEFELATDGYTLLNAGVSYTHPVRDEYLLEFYIKGTNLTDEEARVHTSFLKDIAPQRGRSFFAGVVARF